MDIQLLHVTGLVTTQRNGVCHRTITNHLTTSMFKVLVNYQFKPDLSWIGDDYVIFDRSEDKSFVKDIPEDKLIYTENRGNVDYDKLTYLVENYENLPEVFLWGKTNLFKYITPEEYDLVKDNKIFTPLLTKNHKTYSDHLSQVCYYDHNGIYSERNDSWYMNSHPGVYYYNYQQFAKDLDLPCPAYIPFAPGGNYILTREVVHRYSRDLYDKMRSVLPYCQLPGEAHLCERSYYLLWK